MARVVRSPVKIAAFFLFVLLMLEIFPMAFNEKAALSVKAQSDLPFSDVYDIHNIGPYAGCYPQYVVYDQSNGYLYVTVTNPNTVSVVDPSSNSVVMSIPVGSQPVPITYDSSNGNIYVGNTGGYGSVSVVSGATNTVITTIRLNPSGFATPAAMAYDPANQNVYVAVSEGLGQGGTQGGVVVISGSTNSVTATIVLPIVGGGTTPNGVAFNPANNEVYVCAGYVYYINAQNQFSSPISVFPSAAAATLTYDSQNQNLYVTSLNNHYVGVVYSSSNTAGPIIQIVPPYTFADVFDPLTNEVFVTINPSDMVSVVEPSSNTVSYSITLPSNSFPEGIAWDGSNGNLYVVESNLNILSVLSNAPPRATSTSVNCSPNPVLTNSPANCTATVSGSNPTGTVAWSTNSSTGYFSQNTCSLSSGSCSTNYTDTSAGSVNITASYSGDSSNAPSNGNTTLTIGIWTTSWDAPRDSYQFGNYEPKRAPDGVCYGMSSTAILYFERNFQNPSTNPAAPFFPDQTPIAHNTSELIGPSTVDTLNNSVGLAILAHEIYDPQALVADANTILKADEAYEFQQLVSNISEGQPVTLNMVYTFPNNPPQFHSVVAWAVKEKPDRTYNISIYDPTQYIVYNTTYATFDPSNDKFTYYAYTAFIVAVPEPFQESWFENVHWLWAPSWEEYWLDHSVSGYTIIIADRSITVTSGALTDSFGTLGDSRTLTRNIDQSSGISENNFEIYAIPSTSSYMIRDPSTCDNGTVMLSTVSNESGQLVGLGYLLNISTTQGFLNYTLTPSSSGLSICAGDSGLNASVTCFSATQQGYSVSDVLTSQIGAGQSVNLTAPCSASFTASKNVVGKGYDIPVNVTITNVGNNAENVTLTLCANTTALDSEMVLNLLNGTSVNLACVGNTSGCVYGNYTLSVYCEPNGVNEAANNFTCAGIVQVTIPGDIKGDGVVNILDAIVLGNAFLATPGSSNWNPNADINGDGIVNILDAIILGNHFLQHYP
jgi:YVTN family beta-propeller protein